MIELVFVLLGIACFVYVMFIMAAAGVGLMVIAYKLLCAVWRHIFSLFRSQSQPSSSSKRPRKKKAPATRSTGKPIRRRIAEASHAVGHSLHGASIGNDLTIIAGDQTPGKSLYSELDPPPRTKHWEN